jgi:16S rRNA A1518/A1519 N6-dimethyltransferase RsmA/KsgA/DIM1 with predicted DNA glycosylase/AP lyase activity
MTVLTHYFSVPRYHFKIDRSCFFPVPSVHGAVVTFELLPSTERPAVQNEREFTMFVRQAFLSKRKMLANSLLPKWQRETVNTALSTLGLPSTVLFFRMLSKLHLAMVAHQFHHGHAVNYHTLA